MDKRNRREKRQSKLQKRQTMVILIPLLICIIIILQIFLGVLLPVDQELYRLGNDAVLLEIVGIAISVWIGLNIYNVFTREDVNLLLEESEQVTEETTQIVFTETLLSKFRTSHLDNTSLYLEERLSQIDLLPAEILKKLLELEDLFSIAGKHSKNRVRSGVYIKGQAVSESLIDMIESYSKYRQINSAQRDFVKGYLLLRKADFLYFELDVDEHDSELDRRKAFITNAVECFENSLELLFRIGSIHEINNINRYTEAEQQCIAYITHSIGSTYIVGYNKAEIEKLDDCFRQKSVKYEERAKALSKEAIPSKYRSQIIRNLGVAYERACRFDDAIYEYHEAYALNPRNPKCAYCLGSWYRKNACYHATKRRDSIISDITSAALSDEVKQLVVQNLKKSLYWHEKQYYLSYKQDDVLLQLCEKLFELTLDNEYGEKIRRYSEEKNQLAML